MGVLDMVKSAGVYSGDFSSEYTSRIIQMLSAAVADEVQAWFQYRFVAPFLTGFNNLLISSTFESLADDELEDHCYGLLTRISQLGGDISAISSPDKISQVANCTYFTPIPPYDVKVCLEQNIKAEECAIREYKELLTYCTSNHDAVTSLLIQRILADEEDHLNTLNSFLSDVLAVRG